MKNEKIYLSKKYISLNNKNNQEFITELVLKMQMHFEEKTNGFALAHNITRCISVWCSGLALSGILFLLLSADFIGVTKLENVSEFSFSDTLFNEFNIWGLIFFSLVPTVFRLACDLSTMSKLKATFLSLIVSNLGWYLFLPLILFCLMYFDFDELFSIFLVLGIFGFVISYSVNSKKGYTKAWSRNRYAWQMIQSVQLQFKAGLVHEEIAAEQIFKIYENSKEQAHKDIVKDYETYGNAALGWVKGLKK